MARTLTPTSLVSVIPVSTEAPALFMAASARSCLLGWVGWSISWVNLIGQCDWFGETVGIENAHIWSHLHPSSHQKCVTGTASEMNESGDAHVIDVVWIWLI